MYCETFEVASTSPRHAPQWTDKAVIRLRDLWPNHGCSEIAAKLTDEGFGTFTRAAVIGKIHRLGLSLKQKENVHPSTPLALISQMRVSFGHQIGGEPRHISLIDLRRNDCRWPFGEGPFTFCGHPKAFGSSYCPAHQVLARGEGTPAERAAHRIPKEAA